MRGAICCTGCAAEFQSDNEASRCPNLENFGCAGGCARAIPWRCCSGFSHGLRTTRLRLEERSPRLGWQFARLPPAICRKTGNSPYTRNPLYLGSSLLAAGFAVTGDSWADAALVIGYFAVFYYAVMRNEEADLRRRFGPAFEEYSSNVPLFLPQFASRRGGAWRTLPSPTKTFSWALYRRNREYNALIGTLIGIGMLWVRMWLHWRWGR